LKANNYVNGLTPGGSKAGPSLSDALKLGDFFTTHRVDAQKLDKELQELKAEAIRLGVASP
jgi:hypothetical protein